MKCITVIFLLDIFIAVEGWPCVSTIGRVYSQINTDSVLQFTAYLTNLNSPRTFRVKFHDGSVQAVIRYNTDRSSLIIDVKPGVSITGNSAGNVVVTLQDVLQTNAGIYTMDNTGIALRCTCLYILGTPVTPSITLSKQPSVGESAILTCSSTSTTIPSNHSLSLNYNWRVDNVDNPSGSRYSYSSNSNTLTLSNVVKDDADKQFMCTATEVISGGHTSSMSGTFSFVVHYGPENLDFSPSDTSYEREENTDLNPVTCTASCNPPCSFKWTKIGQAGIISNTAVLSLGRLTSSEAGTYRCTATRSGSSGQTKDLTVIVIYGPYQPSTHLSPTAEDYIRNEKTTLPEIICSADCYPNCTYTWTKTQQGKIATVSSTGILSLGALDRDDAATYICTAENPGKSTSPKTTKQVKVTVQYGPENIDFSPSDTSYESAENTEFNQVTCTASCNPPCSFTWAKIGQAGIISNTAVLSLGRLTTSEAGTYRCTATRSGSYGQTKDLTVNVTSASFFIEGHTGQKDVTVDEYATNIQFNCKIESNKESRIQILFKDLLLKEALQSTVLTFTRSSIMCSHAGIYTCKGSSQHAEAPSSNINLFVRCSPRPLQQIKQNKTSSLYVPTSLTFTIIAYPEPGPTGFLWHKENGVVWMPLLSNNDLLVSSSGLQSNLTILNVSQSDYGRYKVTATNDIGSYVHYLFLEREDIQKETYITESCEVESNKTGTIVGICFGILSSGLAVYAVYLTVLHKRRSNKKGKQATEDLNTQMTYINVAEEGTDRRINDSSGNKDDSTKLYTELAHYSKDDKSAYDVIQKN